jgi:outer membrane protein assembly factor BamB
MAPPSTDPPLPKPLRLWPGVVAVALQWLGWWGGTFLPGVTGGYITVLSGFLGGMAVLVWWAFFSRASRSERWGAVVLMIVALAATPRILHPSIATGMMGMMFPIYAAPVLSLAFVAWAVATRHLPDGPRQATMVATILLACGAFALLRTAGLTGEGEAQLAWRWTETPEERLLARASDETTIPAPAPAAARAPGEGVEPPPLDEPEVTPPAPGAPLVAPADDGPEALASTATQPQWPGFRGPGRDGIVRGVRIGTDWSTSPPEELWRRPVGPGWSSFAVDGDRLYTQEQRGEDEIVACYGVRTGEPVWRHGDAARFWESNGGAGPRATPTLHDGRVYTLGATGILNALDARDGSVVWSRNAASDTEEEVPGWGFASSPLVVGDALVVATAGRLVAYDLASGEALWLGPTGGWGYSSPHLASIDGVPQVLLLNGAGVISVAPADGALLWEYSWTGDGIVQPALTEDGDVLIGTGSGMGADPGVLRLAVARGSGPWTTEERWTSTGLKPYFNDFVVHEGHAYGFDGGILSCIDLEEGARRWKGGRYGHGQLVLLANQDLLLVLSEKGELALVAATPDEFHEVARFPAIEGKTWNHPVLVDDVLLVRNDREMAAFRLPSASE